MSFNVSDFFVRLSLLEEDVKEEFSKLSAYNQLKVINYFINQMAQDQEEEYIEVILAVLSSYLDNDTCSAIILSKPGKFKLLGELAKNISVKINGND